MRKSTLIVCCLFFFGCSTTLTSEDAEQIQSIYVKTANFGFDVIAKMDLNESLEKKPDSREAQIARIVSSLENDLGLKDYFRETLITELSRHPILGTKISDKTDGFAIMSAYTFELELTLGTNLRPSGSMALYLDDRSGNTVANVFELYSDTHFRPETIKLDDVEKNPALLKPAFRKMINLQVKSAVSKLIDPN